MTTIMDSAVAELVLSGVFYKKTEFVIYVCQKSCPELLNYINLYEELRGNKPNKRYIANNWIFFLKSKEEVGELIKSKHLMLDKDFWIEENEEGESDLVLNTKSFYRLLNEDSIDCLSQVKYIYEEYKYYLDNLLYLNINICDLNEKS